MASSSSLLFKRLKIDNPTTITGLPSDALDEIVQLLGPRSAAIFAGTSIAHRDAAKNIYQDNLYKFTHYPNQNPIRAVHAAYTLRTEIYEALKKNEENKYYPLAEQIIASGFEKLLPALIPFIAINFIKTQEEYSTLLLKAAATGNLNATKLLIDTGADITYCGTDKKTDVGGKYVLHTYVRFIRNAGPTVLMAAAASGEAKCLEYLYDRFPHHHKLAAVNHQTPLSRQTALHWAAKFGKTDCVAFLLQCGANPHFRDSMGKRALELTKNEECMRLLKTAMGIEEKEENESSCCPWSRSRGRISL